MRSQSEGEEFVAELVNPTIGPGLEVLNHAAIENVLGDSSWVAVDKYEPAVPGSDAEPAPSGPLVELTAPPWAEAILVPLAD